VLWIHGIQIPDVGKQFREKKDFKLLFELRECITFLDEVSYGQTAVFECSIKTSHVLDYRPVCPE
jgi:hypothetical protein